ncbi:MAG: hypothetical protein ACI8S6_004503, partial [Myxococcota bacterium]
MTCCFRGDGGRIGVYIEGLMMKETILPHRRASGRDCAPPAAA